MGGGILPVSIYKGKLYFLFSREYITKYVLGINISTKTLKNKMIEIVTKLTYRDPNENKRKSHFEISFATVIRMLGEKVDKVEIEKILLCDVQNEIYPELETILIKLIIHWKQVIKYMKH